MEFFLLRPSGGRATARTVDQMDRRALDCDRQWHHIEIYLADHFFGARQSVFAISHGGLLGLAPGDGADGIENRIADIDDLSIIEEHERALHATLWYHRLSEINI